MVTKILDMGRTLGRFEDRIRRRIHRSITPEDRRELEGVYLSTYECYSTLTSDLENTHRQCNSAIVLMRIFRELGIHILGVTSERTKGGRYVTKEKRDGVKVVYVGKHSYFTDKRSYKWRLLPQDRVYLVGPVPPPPDPSRHSPAKSTSDASTGR